MIPYKKSIHTFEGSQISIASGESGDVLLVKGDNPGFEGTPSPDGLICALSHKNAQLLRQLFPFTSPRPVLSSQRTIGLGDRLGIATSGQLRAVEKYDVVPILAQQSIRELNLTNQTFDHVLDAATFAVFREDFQRGFGADGDHLKTGAEVEYALGCGYSMITLDCSEHIRNDVCSMSVDEVNAAYEKNSELESLYLDKCFDVEGSTISFPEEEFRRTYLTYDKAINHAEHIFFKYIQGHPIDFEISIDETMTSTTPAQHYFVANELIRRGIKVTTVAPRFCGEFQKGIDYIGDIAQFSEEFKIHAAIARHFGYKISVHSGSDKFSIFPIVGRLSKGNFHVKTAGTNWLEAMRVVAKCDPALYREVHKYALSAFSEATKYYHVTTDLSKIPDVDTLSDSDLPLLFEQNDPRQLIHITYGMILNAVDDSGQPMFRKQLYELWHKEAEVYAQHLDRHISKHLQLLYSEVGK